MISGTESVVGGVPRGRRMSGRKTASEQRTLVEVTMGVAG